MKWRYETMTEKYKRLSQWHDWFAWHPVFQRGQAIWLEKVRRRAKEQLVVITPLRRVLIVLSLPYEALFYVWEYDI